MMKARFIKDGMSEEKVKELIDESRRKIKARIGERRAN
jgi:hypothetical protein